MPIKGKQTSTCLDICFCDFRCSGSLSGSVEVSRLKMASNKFNSLWKTFNIKIMTFSPVLKMLGRYCMKLYVKTDKKSRSMEKQVVSNYTLHFYLCKFVPFSFLQRTWRAHSEVSFIIYLALSMPSYFLLYVLWKLLKGLQKHSVF